MYNTVVIITSNIVVFVMAMSTLMTMISMISSHDHDGLDDCDTVVCHAVMLLNCFSAKEESIRVYFDTFNTVFQNTDLDPGKNGRSINTAVRHVKEISAFLKRYRLYAIYLLHSLILGKILSDRRFLSSVPDWALCRHLSLFRCRINPIFEQSDI
jgi:hypothetical protein